MASGTIKNGIKEWTHVADLRVGEYINVSCTEIFAMVKDASLNNRTVHIPSIVSNGYYTLNDYTNLIQTYKNTNNITVKAYRIKGSETATTDVISVYIR